MVGPARPLFVLFGSSIVQFSFGDGGWGSILANLYSRQADILVRGYAGWNSRQALQVLHHLFPKDSPIQPSLVIVYFGGNDSVLPFPSSKKPCVPLSEYVENMKKIAIHLKSLSEKTRVIFLTAPPVSYDLIKEKLSLEQAECRTLESCRKYAEACKELCKKIDVKCIDVWSAIQKRDDWLTSCFTDGVHLTAEGSEIVAEEILKVLEEADWEPSLHWKTLPIEFDIPIELSPKRDKKKKNRLGNRWPLLDSNLPQ
ncbi:GDSL esterase/lipase At2g38180-like isoform X2 [Cucumis melo]|uniref:GDSL esterase/lipase At2g38180-like isoform X2 n=1 Tax=Cucumis melo TaxID=3656 RepID=A0ABM3KR12_CUCME|nr:GDSL esterase/lipase At2g38180-like isoform X2 [Cucumis melo]